MMERLIQITHPGVNIEGMLKVPNAPKGLVLFAHGSGSSRFSPRNNFVSNVLVKQGFATLLIDLLSKQEDEIYESRFDIDLLTERLKMVVYWLKREPETSMLPLGLFGASTGAAAALSLAAFLPKEVHAVVSRGGRPDLAKPFLHNVSAPTLLIVGGNDFGVIELNKQAYEALPCIKQISIIPNATHLFEEPGALESVAQKAKEWFETYLEKKQPEK